MNNPLVSVIIPNYNHAKYLDERIQTVLNQTYQDIEVIILDDCSPDNGASWAVIEKYRTNPHVSQIIYNEQNCGKVFKQWYKGIGLAKGELIWIAESDDKSELTFLERTVKCFEQDEELVLAFCRSYMFDDNGNKRTLDAKGLREGFYNGKVFIRRFMSHCCPMLNASACLFKKEAFYKVDDYFTTFTASGDRMFWTEIAECGKVAVVDERLNHYRKHGFNSTEKTYKLGINQKECKLIMDYILNKGYISGEEYASIRKDYIRKFIFQFISDSKLKKELYRYWNCGFMEQLGLKLEAYKKKVLG